MKQYFPILSKIFFWLWLLTLIIFTGIIFYVDKSLAGIYSDLVTNILIINIPAGAIAFILCFVFGVLSLFTKRKVSNKVQQSVVIKSPLHILIPIFAMLLVFATCGYVVVSSIVNNNDNNQVLLDRKNFVVTSTQTPTPKPRVLDGGRLFNLVNEYRAKNGLSQLTWYWPLCEYAKERSSEIKNDWSHDQFMQDSGDNKLYGSVCTECSAVGETLAQYQTSEEGILSDWINSPAHKAILDGNYDWACAMIYQNTYTSMNFGKSK